MTSLREVPGSPRSRQATRSLRLPVQPNWRLQEARENLGVSLPTLAAMAGIPNRQTVYDAENGHRRPTNATRKRIINALNAEARRQDPSAELLRVTDIWPSPLVVTK